MKRMRMNRVNPLFAAKWKQKIDFGLERENNVKDLGNQEYFTVSPLVQLPFIEILNLNHVLDDY